MTRPGRSSGWTDCSTMDEAAREAHLDMLQDAADGPTQSFTIYESSLDKAIACGVLSVLLVVVGGWLLQATTTLAAHLSAGLLVLMVVTALVFLLSGLGGLVVAEALRRRHGQRVLAVTRDTLCFANALEPVPWVTFDGFDVDQKHLTIRLMFCRSGFSTLPALTPVRFKSLAAPHAYPIAGDLQVKLWMCAPTLAGKRMDIDDLVRLLFPYLEAAQARRTLGLLYPEVEQWGRPANG